MFGSAQFDLLSPQSRAEIVRALTDETDRWWAFSGARPFVASVSNDGFSLRVRQWYRNSFQTHLRARFHDEVNGTRMSCRVGMHPFVVGFMVVWFGLVATIAVGVITTFTASEGLGILPGVFFTALMGVFGVGLVWIGRWLAREETPRMLAFLSEVIDAERVG